jgi:dTDP-4-dehydrorhamnose reductase
LGASIIDASVGRDIELIRAPRSVDISDGRLVSSYVREVAPDWIVNCAAMTDVDGAHLAPEKAMAVNGLGPANLARSSDDIGARLVQVSTEAVFDGELTVPYVEGDACRPVSVYGVSKLAGDLTVSVYSPDSYVIRTSWLYSGATGMNFPTRLLAQLDDADRPISVVTDLIGNPTPTPVLASAILAVLAAPPEPGTYHVCCREPASKYDWAVEIAERAGHDAARITPVTMADYPSVARRPTHVDLDCSKFLSTGLSPLPTWREAWRDIAG